MHIADVRVLFPKHCFILILIHLAFQVWRIKVGRVVVLLLQIVFNPRSPRLFPSPQTPVGSLGHFCLSFPYFDLPRVKAHHTTSSDYALTFDQYGPIKSQLLVPRPTFIVP